MFSIFIPDFSISARNSETFTLVMIFLTVFAIKIQYKNNNVIQKKSKRLLIAFSFFFILVAWEYSNAIHLDMAYQHDDYLDAGIVPKGETEAEFRQRYKEYIQQYPEHISLNMYLKFIIVIFIRLIFFIYLFFTFTKLASLAFKNRKQNDRLINRLFILPLSVPILMFILVLLVLIYGVMSVFL
ncbi:MAG: hypothetical protein ACPG8V_04675 [Alphaproteobacteria bacterium]